MAKKENGIVYVERELIEKNGKSFYTYFIKGMIRNVNVKIARGCHRGTKIRNLGAIKRNVISKKLPAIFCRYFYVFYACTNRINIISMRISSLT